MARCRTKRSRCAFGLPGGCGAFAVGVARSIARSGAGETKLLRTAESLTLLLLMDDARGVRRFSCSAPPFIYTDGGRLPRADVSFFLPRVFTYQNALGSLPAFAANLNGSPRKVSCAHHQFSIDVATNACRPACDPLMSSPCFLLIYLFIFQVARAKSRPLCAITRSRRSISGRPMHHLQIELDIFATGEKVKRRTAFPSRDRYRPVKSLLDRRKVIQACDALAISRPTEAPLVVYHEVVLVSAGRWRASRAF